MFVQNNISYFYSVNNKIVKLEVSLSDYVIVLCSSLILSPLTLHSSSLCCMLSVVLHSHKIVSDVLANLVTSKFSEWHYPSV